MVKSSLGWARTNQLLSGFLTGTVSSAFFTPRVAAKSCERRRAAGSNGFGGVAWGLSFVADCSFESDIFSPANGIQQLGRRHAGRCPKMDRYYTRRSVVSVLGDLRG